MMVPPPTQKEVEQHRKEAEEYDTFASDWEVERYGRILATATILAIGIGAVVADGAMGAIM